MKKKQNKEFSFALSYESDGQMGKDNETKSKKDEKKEANLFFNQTQDSE